jgi:hypothetical protein
MGEDEPSDNQKPRDISITVNTGDYAVMGEGLIAHVHGPTRDGIRVSDSRGWCPVSERRPHAGDLPTSCPAADPGRHHLGRARRTRPAHWQRRGCTSAGHPRPESSLAHAGDPSRGGEFWERLQREASSNLTSSTTEEAAHRLWTAIQRKRLHAHRDVVLALNAIRTPWLALPHVVDAFRRLHGQAARGMSSRRSGSSEPSRRSPRSSTRRTGE